MVYGELKFTSSSAARLLLGNLAFLIEKFVRGASLDLPQCALLFLESRIWSQSIAYATDAGEYPGTLHPFRKAAH